MGTRVYVGNLYHSTREKDIEKFFNGYGRICDIFLKNGYGFVEFANQRDADDAVYDLNGKELLGERVTVEVARGRRRDRFGGPGGGGGGGRDGGRDRGGGRGGGDRRPAWLDKYGPPERTDYRLVVENLSSRVSWQDLKDYFRRAGDITFADAHRPRMNEGIVEFANYDDMRYALDKYDDTELKGRRILLSEDKPSRSSRKKERRSRSRSRRHHSSSSRSRSRSASHSRKRHYSSSGSRSPVPKKRSRSKSRSPVQRKQSPSRSRSRSPRANRNQSRSPRADRNQSRSKSRSRSPSVRRDDSALNCSRSRSRSKSKSAERANERYSRSRSRESSKSGGRRSESR